MSDQVLATIIAGVFAVLVAYVGRQANNAAKWSKPTGNGFAAKVLAKLETNEEHNEDHTEQLREVRLDILELFKRDAIDHEHNRKTDEFIATASDRLANLEKRKGTT